MQFLFYFYCVKKIQFNLKMPVDTKLSEQRRFWKILFEQENLASHLLSLSTYHPNDDSYELPNFGQVNVRVSPGSALGDNFNSDTFSVTAEVAPRNSDGDGLIFRTFVKVGEIMSN